MTLTRVCFRFTQVRINFHTVSHRFTYFCVGAHGSHTYFFRFTLTESLGGGERPAMSTNGKRQKKRQQNEYKICMGVYVWKRLISGSSESKRKKRRGIGGTPQAHHLMQRIRSICDKTSRGQNGKRKGMDWRMGEVSNGDRKQLGGPHVPRSWTISGMPRGPGSSSRSSRRPRAATRAERRSPRCRHN